jgi:acyl carrier protein
MLESGIVDSLGLLTIIAYLEETFGIRVNDEEVVIDNFGSVDSMVAYLSRKMSRNHPIEGGGTSAVDSAPGIA